MFRPQAGPLSADQLGQALTFAEIAMSTLLDGQGAARPGTAAEGLTAAMDSGAELFQTQGMVMVQLGVSISDALTRLSAYAFAHSRPLNEVARDVIARRLHFDRDEP